MKVAAPHILLLGSRKDVVEALRPHVSTAELDRVASFFDQTVVALFQLGQRHHRFGRTLAPSNWRQTISRAYYGAYNISRAVRLATGASYSQTVSDHKHIDAIPKGFPNESRYRNRLRILRQDRNLADYEPNATMADLSISRIDAITLVDSFVADSRQFCRTLGHSV